MTFQISDDQSENSHCTNHDEITISSPDLTPDDNDQLFTESSSKTSKNFLPDLLAALTVVIFTGAAILLQILWIREPFVALFEFSLSVVYQIIIGMFLGTGTAYLVFRYVEASKTFEGIRDLSFEMIKMLNPSFRQIIFISLAAGWGEELLFRGILYPKIGNFLSSIIFAGIHVGFSFKDSGKRQYFISIFFVSLGLGVIYAYLGLVAAMMTHAFWDFVMLIQMKKLIRKANVRV